MPNILVKRSGETRLFDIDCSAILGQTESIVAVSSINGDASTAPALTFGTPAINATSIIYPDRRQVGPGKVIQVLIGGGGVVAGSEETEYTVRARFTTNNPGELCEATVAMMVRDKPGP